jgi:hypothetical protein
MPPSLQSSANTFSSQSRIQQRTQHPFASPATFHGLKEAGCSTCTLSKNSSTSSEILVFIRASLPSIHHQLCQRAWRSTTCPSPSGSKILPRPPKLVAGLGTVEGATTRLTMHK